MTKEPKQGDKVAWNTPQGETHGEVVDIVGEKDDPRYVVESAKSGKRATHRAEALKKR
jgi:hypothetical protein